MSGGTAARPYGLGGEAAAIHRTAQLRTLREAKSLPYRTQKLSVFSMYVTGRVREPTCGYNPRASLSGGTAARPYSLGGEAAAIHRTAQLRTLREAKSLPYRTQKLSVFSMYVTGRVREPTCGYNPRASLSGGTAARPYSLGGEAAAIHRTAQLRTLREAKSLPYRLRSFRFSLCTLPGRFGNQRIGTGSVRHYPAALPPPYVFPSGRRGLDLFFSHSQGIMHW